jgi:hypothetical protein
MLSLIIAELVGITVYTLSADEDSGWEDEDGGDDDSFSFLFRRMMMRMMVKMMMMAMADVRAMIRAIFTAESYINKNNFKTMQYV